MAISDAVVGNLTMIYLAVIAGIKAYGLLCGRSYGGVFVLVVSSTLVGFILVGTLTWDVTRKATYAISRDHSDAVNVQEMCKGGICWHGVAVRSPASQVTCFGTLCSGTAQEGHSDWRPAGTSSSSLLLLSLAP